MTGKAQFLLSTLLLAALLAACAPGKVPEAQSAAPPAPATAAPKAAPASVPQAAPVRPAWQEEWDQVVAAAKREGSPVLYTGMGGQQRQIVAAGFLARWGIRVEAVTGSSSSLAPKIIAEQRAGIYSGDLTLMGSTSYAQLPGLLEPLDSVLILPDLTQPEVMKKTWYFGELSWANKAHTMLIGLMDNQQPVSINTTLVKQGEINTYRDLLDPRWKGKISLQDPQVSGMGNMWFAAVLELGDADVSFMRELASKQELFITRDRRLQVEWLARAKHAIALGPDTATVSEFIQLGTPLSRFNPATPFISGIFGLGMLKRPPHPNSAKLFVNWLLSQEGQTFHSQAVGSQSQRLDVSVTHLEPSKVLKPGLKVYRADNERTEEFAVKRTTVYSDLAKEIFASPAK